MVPLSKVWERGLEMNFPKTILALSLEACAFTRRLFFKGAMSSPAHTLTALLAGLGFANEMLFLVLVEPMDGILREWPGISACLVADDIKLAVAGEQSRVAADMDRAAC